MLTLPDDLAPAFREAVRLAATRPQVQQALQRLYLDFAQAVEARKPVCLASGRCCRFEEFGHRLFISTLEMAAFVSQLPEQPWPSADGPGCPFQLGKLCEVHTLRPFGCRVFFCDPSAQEWQQQQYELVHTQLKLLHEKLQVPYFYVEWRAALRALGL